MPDAPNHDSTKDEERLQQIRHLESRIVKQKAHIDKLLTDCPYKDHAARLGSALTWALGKMDRGDGVLEYTGTGNEGDAALAALAAWNSLNGGSTNG